jgi:hypothetical protein
MIKLTANAHESYKIGVDEIEGLKAAMIEVMKPVQASIKRRTYWSDVELEEAEYKSRDGFIPHSHNCGGIQLDEVIPKCEESNFDFLEFGECDDEECNHEQECGYESEGHLDAKLRIWLKFEGYDEETGELSFWLYCGGGNGDAPYFRTQYETDIFEASFTCKSVAGLKRAAAKHVNALLKVIGA